MGEPSFFTLWPEILTEILVFLGRPLVQLQLAVGGIALILSQILGRFALTRWNVWADEKLDIHQTAQKFIRYLVTHLMKGSLILLFLQVGKWGLAATGNLTALIDALSNIVLIYLAIQFALVIAWTVGNPEGISRYQNLLITPLVVVLGLSQLGQEFFPSGRLLNAPMFTLFDNSLTFFSLMLVTIGFYLWLVGVQAVSQSALYLATRYGGAEEGATQAFITLTRYMLIIGGLAYVMSRLNFSVTTIAAISGGLSVGVGFALSTILGNFISGILLLFEGTLHPGDVVDFNGELNIIETISIRSIRTRTLDNVERVIPNNDFLSSSFTTYTGKSRFVRLKLRIGVSYQDNHRLVIETLLDVAKASEAILQQPTPEVRVFQFGDFSIDYDLLIWVPDPLLIPRIRNEMHQGILDAFEAKGIKIPFPVVEILDGGKAS